MIHLLRFARLGDLRLYYGKPDSWLPVAEEPYRESGRRVSTSPLVASKSSAIEIGTSGPVDPPVDAPIVSVEGRTADVGVTLFDGE